MTKAELIKQLEIFSPDTKIVISDEGVFTDLKKVKQFKMVKEYNEYEFCDMEIGESVIVLI
jgi:hypothetical protein